MDSFLISRILSRVQSASQSNSSSTIELSIEDMTCQGCARHATEALQGVAGVDSAQVRLDQAAATVRVMPDATVLVLDLIAAVEAAGFKAKEMQSADNAGAASTGVSWSGWKLNVLLGVPATLFFMIAEWGFGVGMEGWFHWAGFAVALPVQILCGGRFYRGAWNQLKRGQSNMDTLVSLGSTTAFAYSAWGLFAGWEGHLYFMESVGIITFVSVGHWMEALTSSKAAGAMEALLNLAPEKATRIVENGAEEHVPVAELRRDDRVILKPGDRVPVDGDVIEGASAVDESMLTGESLPIDKIAGAKLCGGTLNQNGRLVMRVTETGDATALAKIIAVVQRAQSSRANIQKLGDKVSSVFVPIVILIAILTAAAWFWTPAPMREFSVYLSQFLWSVSLPEAALTAAVLHAAAVLIVSCPCAMGLATPIAIMAGTNVAARRGILIRDGEALEKSGTIDAVLFDKTGTLTAGHPGVEARIALRGEAGRLLPLAQALAQPSRHPLSRAIVNAATDAPDAPELRDWEELQGRGIQANGPSGRLRLGSLNWLQESDVPIETTNAFTDEWTAKGATVIGLAENDALLGAFALIDSLKPGAAEVIDTLRRDGAEAWLISGDHESAAREIARQARIAPDHVFAEIRPEQKAGIVERLQSEGRRVAFVGDGINDAPALKQADLGIAVSRASDVAREAADIILLNSAIHSVPAALDLAKATLRTIKQNLFWAFFYNAAAIPLAALGFLNPMLCAAAMGFSDLVVVGNALRLRRHGQSG